MHTLKIALSLAAIVAVSTFAQEISQPPEPRAQAVWDYLQEQGYEEWELWPGTDSYYQGTEPHGALLTTYLNEQALRALENSAPLPVGSIIVKENYMPDRTLAAVTVMYKASEGYNPGANDWFWLKRLPDGDFEAAGQVAGCQDCHQQGDRDFIRSPLP